MIRFFCGFLVVAAAAGAATATGTDALGAERILVPGDMLPRLSGTFLTGEKAILPEAAAGRVALLALGFTYDSRFAVEKWITTFREKFQSRPEITFFEIPMLGGFAGLGRWFIERGMRNGTPKDLHRNVITVYGGIGDWKERLGYKEKDAAYLILIDRKGLIRWLHAGPFDEQKFAELLETMGTLVIE